MKASVLNMESEALEEFREKMDAALAVAICRMKEKRIMTASVTGKIKIELVETTDVQGQILTTLELKPEVNVNMKTQAKVACGTQNGLFVQLDEEGRPIVGSCQVEIEDLMEEMAAEEGGA